MNQLIIEPVRQDLGAVRRGRAARRAPGRGALHVPAALDRQRPHRRRRQGMSASGRDACDAALARAAPRRLRAVRARAARRARRRGRRAAARPARVRRRARRAALRARRRAAQRRGRRRRGDRRRDAGGAPSFPVVEPASCATAGCSPAATPGYAWLNGARPQPHEVAGRRRLRAHGRPGRAGVAPARRSSTRSSPTASRRRGSSVDAARVGDPARAGTSCRRAAASNTPHELYGGDLRGVEQHLDHIESLGANLIYLTPFFPARQHAPLRRDELRPRRPAARRRRRAALARASGARARHPRRRRHHAEPLAATTHEWFLRAQADPSRRPSAASTSSTTRSPHGYESWLGDRDAARS